jgi:hypothetical protein
MWPDLFKAIEKTEAVEPHSSQIWRRLDACAVNYQHKIGSAWFTPHFLS